MSTEFNVTGWAEAARSDGWSEKPGGPWGAQVHPLVLDERFGGYVQTGRRTAGDRSRLLVKADMRVILVDRELVGADGVTRTEQHGTGWFADGGTPWTSFPLRYDAEAIEQMRTPHSV